MEPPGAGDVLRAVGSSRGGMSGLFHVANRGKRSIVSISGFGRSGPYASQRVYDNVIQAFSGMAAAARAGDRGLSCRSVNPRIA